MTTIQFNQRQFNTHVYNRKDEVTGYVPEVIVRAALSENALEVYPTWYNLSDRAFSLDIRRGRQHLLGRFEAGVATIGLKNTDGALWPDNTGGKYYPYILPGKRVNVQVKWGVGVYDLFTGFIEGWRPGWKRAPESGPIMTLTVSDLVKNLSNFIIDDAVGFSSEVSGTRIENVMEKYNLPHPWRSLAAGQTTLQASGALADIEAMAHLFIVQDSEFGYIFVQGDGTVVFHDRHTRITDYSTSQAIFGDDAGENKYNEMEPSYDDEYIYNYVRVERSGGTAQVSEDSTSQSNYGTRGLSRSSLLMTTDNEALAQAQYLKNKYKDPRLRVKVLTIFPGRDSANLFGKIFSYDIGTKITLRNNESSLAEDYHIEGVRHTFDMEREKWITQWQLGPIDESFWQLGIAGVGELGEKTYLGY